MTLRSGIENLLSSEISVLKNKRIAVVCNQSSVLTDYHHILFTLMDLQESSQFKIVGAFGPQHGIWGHTQDNMIEWRSYKDNRFPFPFYSLYGERRDIPEELLNDFDVILFDIQDVGARYYTFIWSLAQIMKSIQDTDIELIVTDRPNPINGIDVEGPVLKEEFTSFVGLHPLPIRHGMTIGEIANYLHREYYPSVKLSVIPMTGWDRNQYLDHYSNYPWVFPSPNMPTIDTAVVYPGMCLLEGTNISEGRGTTRPFEIFGADFIDGLRLCEYLNMRNIDGVYFRFQSFLPTFQKFKDTYCEGAFIHVLNRETFKPFNTALHILSAMLKTYPDDFKWKNPPYEYEYHKLPIDILMGDSSIRIMLEQDVPVEEIEESWQKELNDFIALRKSFLLY